MAIPSSTGKPQAAGTVKAILGEVTAISASGQTCVLQPGDKVFPNDIIQTGDGGAIQIEFANGQVADLGRDSSFLVSEDLFKPNEAQMDDIERIQELIAQGADPTQVTEASAAGGEEDGAHSFVQIDYGAKASVASGLDTGFSDNLSTETNKVGVTGEDVTSGVTVGYDTGGTNNGSTSGTDSTSGSEEQTAQASGTEAPTSAPAPTVAINTIAGDDVVNAAEANADVTVSGSTSGARAGDTVTLTVGNNAYTATVDANGNYSVAVPGSVLADNGSVSASVSVADAVGNSATASTSQSYSVDTTAQASITLDSITPDNLLNAAEAGANVAVTGTVGGDAKAGDTVTLSVGNQTYTGTVAENGTFSIAVPGSELTAYASISASVSATDAVGNSATASAGQSYSVDTEAPAPTVAINTIAGDDVVNAAEANADVTVSGSTSGARAGDTVTLTVGNNTYTATVDANGNYSVSVPGSVLAANDAVAASVTTTDDAGNTGTGEASRAYAVDTEAPTITVSAPDDTKDATPTITGTTNATDGSTVTLTVTQGDTVQTITATVANGTFNADVPAALADGAYTVSASVTDPAGNTGSASDAGSIDTTITATASIATSDVSEDASAIVFNVTLDEPPQGGSATATIRIGETDHQVQIGADGSGTLTLPIDMADVYLDDNGSITATVTDVTGGNYGTVDYSNATATSQISDTVDTTTVSIAVADQTSEMPVTPLANGISHVIFDLADGRTVKIDGYGGDVKDPSDPAKYSAAIGAEYGSTVTGYTIKAATSHYDEQGNKVDDIPNQATQTTTQGALESEYGNLISSYAGGEPASVTFTITLENPGQTDVTVTTNHGNVSIPAGSTTGSLVVAADQSGGITATVTGVSGGNFEAVDFSNATVSVDTEVQPPVITNIIDHVGDYSNVVLYGSGEPGATITLFGREGSTTNGNDTGSPNYVQVATPATIVVANDGTWSVNISNLPNTPINDNEFFRAMQTDSAGNASAFSNTAHYWHGTWSSAATETGDDYAMMGAGNDAISIISDDANDRLVVDGGTGTDTATFQISHNDVLSVVRNDSGEIVVTERNGDIDVLRNFESVQFSDGAYKTDDAGTLYFDSYYGHDDDDDDHDDDHNDDDDHDDDHSQSDRNNGGGNDVDAAPGNSINTHGDAVDGSYTTRTGTDASDFLVGGRGDDLLIGSSGNDLIFGGRGDDILSGGQGSDVLTGGKGSDTFVFGGDSLDGKVDVITDFSIAAAGGDVLDLSDLLSSGGSLSFSDVKTDEHGNTTVSVNIDADGDGAGAAVQLATVTLHGVTGSDPTQALMKQLLDGSEQKII